MEKIKGKKKKRNKHMYSPKAVSCLPYRLLQNIKKKGKDIPVTGRGGP
jgi:hypothetical protein